MSNLPAELAELNAQYEQIFDRFNAGQLTEDQARATLENMVTVDGAGCTWRINPDPDGEEFLRATPGGPFEPCNPMYFQPLSTPSSQPQPPAPWETSAGAPWGASVPSGFPDEHAGTGDGYAGGFGAGGFGSGGSFADSPEGTSPSWSMAPETTEPKPAKSSRLPKLPVGGLVAKVTADKRRLIGVVVIIVGVLVFAVTRSGGSDPTTDPVTTDPDVTFTPVTTGPAPTTVPQVTEPPVTDPGVTVAPETTAPAVAFPADEDVARARAAMTSGSRELALAVVVDPGQPQRSYVSPATWSGFSAIGADVNVEPPSVNADGAIVQRWVVVDRTLGAPVAVAVVQWIIAPDGLWKLATWPVFAES